MNESIRKMLSKPGRYAISNGGYFLHGRYVGIEVDENLVCHQLNPAGERDGVLAEDGWQDDTVCLGELAAFELMAPATAVRQ